MQNNTEESNSQISNPVAGAMSFGLGGAALTAIGASIRDNSVHKEAMTLLVGGVITGAIVGAFGCCLPDTRDASLCFKITVDVLKTGLALAAILSAPAMGEEIMGLETDWSTTVEDQFIGGAVILGGAVSLAAVVTCVAGGAVVSNAIRNTLFGASGNTSTNRDAQNGQLVAIPVVDSVEVETVNVAINKV